MEPHFSRIGIAKLTELMWVLETLSLLRITECPHKLPYLAALLLLLSRDAYVVEASSGPAPTSLAPSLPVKPGSAAGGGGGGGAGGEGRVRISTEILNDLGEQLLGWLEGREWLKVRLTVSWLSDLTWGLGRLGS